MIYLRPPINKRKYASWFLNKIMSYKKLVITALFSIVLIGVITAISSMFEPTKQHIKVIKFNNIYWGDVKNSNLLVSCLQGPLIAEKSLILKQKNKPDIYSLQEPYTKKISSYANFSTSSIKAKYDILKLISIANKYCKVFPKLSLKNYLTNFNLTKYTSLEKVIDICSKKALEKHKLINKVTKVLYTRKNILYEKNHTPYWVINSDVIARTIFKTEKEYKIYCKVKLYHNDDKVYNLDIRTKKNTRL